MNNQPADFNLILLFGGFCHKWPVLMQCAAKQWKKLEKPAMLQVSQTSERTTHTQFAGRVEVRS